MKPLKPYLLWSRLVFLMICIPLVLKAQTNQTVTAGSQSAVVNFPVTTCTYNWVNNNPGIGLAASGTGDIAAFTATNATGSTINATITATPVGPTAQPPLLYIPNYDANTVSVINATTNALMTTIPVGSNPYNVMVSRDYNRVYVANVFSNDVSVIYMPTNRVLATISGFLDPRSMAVAPNNDIVYVANFGTNTVAVVNALNNTITATIQVGQNPVGLALSFDGSILYVSNRDGSISVINTATRTVTNTIPVTFDPFEILLSPNQTKLYVVNSTINEISVINTATNTVTDHITVGRIPRCIAISPDGSRLYVSNGLDNNISIVNTTTNVVIATISVGAIPIGLSINTDGSLLYVANSGINTVSVINTASLTVATTFNVGARPYSIGNFYLPRADCGQTITFNITVNAAATAVIATTGSPSSVSTTYGAPSSPTSFMVSGTNMAAGILVTPPAGFEVSTDGTNFLNTVTVGSSGAIASATVYIRLKKTTAAGTYLGNIVLSSTGASNVNVAMPASNVSRAPVPVNIIADITYGEVLNNITLTPPAFDFSEINSHLKNGEFVTSLDVTVSDGNTGRNPVGIYSNAVHSSNLQGANGFLLSNYNVIYQSGRVSVTPAPLIIAASNVNKPFGNALTSGVSTTGFNVVGLQNNETISSVTIAYGVGSAANAPSGTYNGSVVPSAATGGNGYVATNYNITYRPANIIVASAQPSISTSGILQALTTVYGTPSSPGSFMVSGTNLTAGILITPPAGFEVSADNITFNNTVTIGSANVTSAPVYIRLKSTTIVGSYSGNIDIQSSGATNVMQTMPVSSVTPAQLTITAENKSRLYGEPNPPLTITYNGFVNGDGPAQLTSQSIATTIATPLSDVGQYPITVSGGSSFNYTLGYVNGTLTVFKEISIPNTFTPNGDGINDTWNISNLNSSLKITVEIMDRYGSRVYYSNGYYSPWDGTRNGSQVPFGVYYYIIKGVNDKPLSGYITVVR